ncbi:hypothetical protein DACRYDRAFT_22507 [Dacryopinax primogenitus]|uniref:RTA1-domain-containing protein n=1 Tax=Dacryopinax primogenitus (strain DJM 731) TaxID=1858805 RepID=M5FUC9_DACPD|nr:uncharacterized protein DACRYDRAFT_22507 [Dacryopinax primogenitus]EJU01331.1 hypothetical protein DACRYDRAFT_22507 [Dacryopinax primogenitus]
MADFPIDYAYLVGSWCSAVLWGVYGVLFGLCLWLVFNHGQLHPVQLAALISLYVLATCHITLDFVRLIQGFVFTDSGLPRIYFFSNVALKINVAKDFLYITSLIIGDSVIVWRCWIVWRKKWVVVAFPILMVVGEAIAGYVAIGKYLSPDLTTDTSIKPWGTAMFSISLATNILVTSLTAGRIWWISRTTNKLMAGTGAGTRSLAAITLIIESGLAITLAKIIEFATFQIAFAGTVNMQAIYIMFELMPQLFGIVPTVIILSIQVGVTSSKAYSAGNGPHSLPRNGVFGANSGEAHVTSYGRRTPGAFPIVSVETTTYGDHHASEIELGAKTATMPKLDRKASTDSSLA